MLGLLRFTNSVGGTGDFTYPGPTIDMQSPASAEANDGWLYLYYAHSFDMSEWEKGTGLYTQSTGKFARTSVLANSSGTTAKIDFSSTPQVIVFDTNTSLAGYIDAQLQINGYLKVTPQTWSSAQKEQARDNIGVPRRNRIVNGAMMVSQENGSNAGTTTGYFPVDQFAVYFSNGGAISTQRVASKTPGGSPYRIRVTVTAADAAVAAGDFLNVTTQIEGNRIADLNFGTGAAKQVTLRIGCRGPSGTYGLAFRNGSAAGGTVSRSYVGEITIAAGEANTDVVKSVTFTADTGGSWASDNTSGLNVTVTLMAGSTYQQTPNAWASANCIATSNQFNFMGSNGNVFELFDVSLIDGGVAQDFQLPMYLDELKLSQRYFWLIQATHTYGYGTVRAGATSAYWAELACPVPMCSNPIVTRGTGSLVVSGDQSVAMTGLTAIANENGTLTLSPTWTGAIGSAAQGASCLLYAGSTPTSFNSRL